MAEIKHCPFCGNTNITGATHKPVGSAEFYEVLCVECGARIRRSAKRKAVEAWNRRLTMRLIDADALIEEALTEGAYGYVDAKQIADAPTVDAVPVQLGRRRRSPPCSCPLEYSVGAGAGA